MMPLFGITFLNFGDSQLNYTYSINCLLKKVKNRMISKLPYEKKFTIFLKSCFKFVLLTKKLKERNQHYFPKSFLMQ